MRIVRWGAILACALLAALLAGGSPERCPPLSGPLLAEGGVPPREVPGTMNRGHGERVGEVSQDSAVLQARLTASGKVRQHDVQGCPGLGAFVLSRDKSFDEPVWTNWLVASAENDYQIKTRVMDLEPSTRYYYRLVSGPGVGSMGAGPEGTFRTLDPPGVAREVRFVAVTGMNHFAFHALAIKNLAFRDLAQGFPALETIVAHQPDFFVATGDSVYYDTPYFGRAETREQMRAKWHRQFATPRFARLFLSMPTYWEKDDHDFRYDDADPYGDVPPSADLGAKVFVEQVPLADPGEETPPTYRTLRVNDLLQIWLIEARDHRDPNTRPPGPDKTMWGAEQRSWLQQTLLESDAAFKLLVSPLPLVGPDDANKGGQGGILAPYFGGRPLGQEDDNRKRDNQTNPFGFQAEGEAFFAWLVDHGFRDRGLYLICGDRHWQYHSVHPSGFEEFSVGALVEANSRQGREPGDPESTDPEALVVQPYLQARPMGGFLEVTVTPGQEGQPPTAEFAFYDEHGTLLYRVDREAQP